MMREENPGSPATQADARMRAFRVLLWGLGFDVAGAVVVVLLASVNSLQWTREYWVALGLSVAKSAIVSGVAYLGRLLLKPKV